MAPEQQNALDALDKMLKHTEDIIDSRGVKGYVIRSHNTPYLYFLEERDVETIRGALSREAVTVPVFGV